MDDWWSLLRSFLVCVQALYSRVRLICLLIRAGLLKPCLLSVHSGDYYVLGMVLQWLYELLVGILRHLKPIAFDFCAREFLVRVRFPCSCCGLLSVSRASSGASAFRSVGWSGCSYASHDAVLSLISPCQLKMIYGRSSEASHGKCARCTNAHSSQPSLHRPARATPFSAKIELPGEPSRRSPRWRWLSSGAPRIHFLLLPLLFGSLVRSGSAPSQPPPLASSHRRRLWGLVSSAALWTPGYRSAGRASRTGGRGPACGPKCKPGEPIPANRTNQGSVQGRKEKKRIKQRKAFIMAEKKKRKAQYSDAVKRKEAERTETKMAAVARERAWAERLIELKQLEEEKKASMA